ncbi:integrase [Gracilibacillus halophilus YIM-C55.5]|uniref:Integrase n=1 Tax=Gracilibacillus halophilus YIM-C55.5 TaxID=1308866 RepID=N4WEX1_9BACI|nr:integrase [Gracilibacillus halophilus YIM-C55.5]
MDYIITNPFDKITLPKPQDQYYIKVNGKRENFYSKQELKDFLHAIEDEPLNHTFFHLAAYTGARKGELLALNWSDINFANKTIHIYKNLYFEKKQNQLLTTKYPSSDRIIAIDNDTISVLREWKQEQMKQYKSINQSFLEDDLQPVFTK